MEQNVFFEKNNLKDQAFPFAKLKLDQYMPALKFSIEQIKSNMKSWEEKNAPATFENTILFVEQLTEKLEDVAGIFSNLEAAHGTEEQRKLSPEFYAQVSEVRSFLSLNEKLFEKTKFVYDQLPTLNLTLEQKQLVKRSYESFVRNGALLKPEQKKRLEEIDQLLSALDPEFSKNIIQVTKDYQLWVESEKSLAGIPAHAVAAAKLAAEKNNQPKKWLFTLQAPSFMALITYCKDRSLRKQIWFAYNSRAFEGANSNQETALRYIQFRSERARLLGFKNHAEYVLQDRMAQTVPEVQKFLKKIFQAALPKAKLDWKELSDFALQMDGMKDFSPWDVAYYAELLKEKKYAFSDEDLRPYFKLENVIDGVFEHAKKLYDLNFKETFEVDKYHPDVRVFEVFDSKTERYIGLLYTDFFPRDTKQAGAWMTAYRNQGLHDGQIKRPHIGIVCNFTPSTPTTPSLLTHMEVRTLFHEFGHALHGLLTDCTYRSLSGTNVLWDFVELPSQIMENWTEEKEALDLFARHYQTGEAMPEKLIESLRAASNFLSGWMTLRQVQHAALDLAWYSGEYRDEEKVSEFENRILAPYRLQPAVSGTNISCSFGHIFPGGYSAGYYSYQWAEVLDADAFEFFKERGIFNPEVSHRFRDIILKQGGTKPPQDLYKEFRGRDPDPDALLRRNGLLS